MHHLILFLPILALALFFWLPWQIALAIYLPVLVGSILGYWKALQALRQPPVTGRRKMIGERAKVVKAEGGEVEVEFRGEIWKAVSSTPLAPGQDVIIERVDGLTLKVGALPQ